MRISGRMGRELEATAKNIEAGVQLIRIGMERGDFAMIRNGADFARHYAEYVEADLGEYWKDG